MKVISTIGKIDGELMGFTPNKEYDVIRLIKSKLSGNTIYGYRVVNDNGAEMTLFPEEGYVPLKTKKNPRWRKILKSMGYRRHTNSWGIHYWINSTGVALVESLIPDSSIVSYVTGMEEYDRVFNEYYMEMESLWTEGEIV